LKARQNPLTKLETLIQRWVEGPFARLFPSKLQPIEIQRRLEREMENNTLLQGEGRRLAPNVYDIFLSMKDHQQIAPSQDTLIREWQKKLVEFARNRHFTLRTIPVIRLHSDTSLHTGLVRIETEVADRQSGNAEGPMATQALSAEQMAQLRAQLAATGQPGLSSPNQPSMPSGALPHSQSLPGTSNTYGPAGSIPSTIQPQMNLPQAWLTIRLPQAGQQTYRIEKPIINIGRQLSNDIIVEDKRVSRYHAQIKFQPDGQFAIFDLGSTNGITINNIPSQRQHILRHGDRFTIGSYDFYFERR
jgi:hypothetical protein